MTVSQVCPWMGSICEKLEMGRWDRIALERADAEQLVIVDMVTRRESGMNFQTLQTTEAFRQCVMGRPY